MKLVHPGATSEATAEDPRYLREQLITYLGNKRALLPLIARAVQRVRQRLGGRKLRVVDLFSGTGVVARFLKHCSSQLIANDLELYSQITNTCYLANRSEIDMTSLHDALAQVERETAQASRGGFIAELYAPADERAIRPGERVFYTRRNAIYLDSARQAIARIAPGLQTYLLAPLLAAASVHANTSGVFKGFYKNAAGIGQYGGSGRDALSRIQREIRLAMPIFSRFDCDWQVHCRDANELAGELPEMDLAYLDPPYNQHPYGSNYFMLNLLASYQRPAAISAVSGIPLNWNRSRYNRRQEAESTLFDLIGSCPARFLLISYNSEGFIPQARLVERLERCGRLRTFVQRYNTFRGSRNLRARPSHVNEFLYLVER